MARGTTKKAAATKSAEKQAEKTAEAPKADTKANNTSKIHRLVQKEGGIAKVTLGDIRDELGHARLGVTVLSSMAEHLTENGLGFFPAWVLTDNPEPRQWNEVHVYERDNTPRSAVLDAVADPENNDLRTALDMFTDSVTDFSKLSADQKMTLVRSIVCS